MSNYAGCHHDAEAPIDADNNGVLFLNSAVARTDQRFRRLEIGRCVHRLAGSTKLHRLAEA